MAIKNKLNLNIAQAVKNINERHNLRSSDHITSFQDALSQLADKDYVWDASSFKQQLAMIEDISEELMITLAEGTTD